MSSDTARHYDLIIIGTGSGNSIPSPAFDDVRIALVEEGRFGGTCLNVGCIPTKMYVLAADAARNVSEAARLGVHAHVDSIDWDSIKQRVFGARIDAIADGGEAYRRGPETPNIDVYDRHAVFVGPRRIRTGQGDEEMEITADQIIVAAGSRTKIPGFVTDSGVKYRTNKDIMRIDRLPEEMIILGGGFIATEFAHVFSSQRDNDHDIVRSGAASPTPTCRSAAPRSPPAIGTCASTRPSSRCARKRPPTAPPSSSRNFPTAPRSAAVNSSSPPAEPPTAT